MAILIAEFNVNEEKGTIALGVAQAYDQIPDGLRTSTALLSAWDT
jgi:hypothetical protein